MAKYRCGICGEIYDDDVEGIPFEQLPDDWRCPVCRASKSDFELIEDDDVPAPVRKERIEVEEDDGWEFDAKLIRNDNGVMDDIRWPSQAGALGTHWILNWMFPNSMTS